MRGKQIKRIGAAALSAVLIFQCAGDMIMADATVLQTTGGISDTQMSSEKEVVYVNTHNTTEREQNFDENWKFYLGDASGAEKQNFDDSTWENVSVPHDYSIEQEYSKAMEAESAYLPGGTGWYRKHFLIGEELEGKQLRIDFGGVYMNSTVWVNGTQLGTHPYGYTPFSYDITDYVNYGEENVITVKVDHKTPSSRWYSGSGIYRSVNLVVTDSVHVDLYGTKIETPNLESEKGGTVNMSVKTTVANAGDAAVDVTLVHTIYEKDTQNSIGTVTTGAVSVAAGETKDIQATLGAANPKLWDIEDPNLYTVVTEVKNGNRVVDTYETEYGFRYFSFDTETGFYLNGRGVKLQGVCMHHDQGSLGSEAYYRAIERQVELLQEMGCNSIRVTHNPADEALIEICNEKGILLIEEVFDGWGIMKNDNTYDYSTWYYESIEEGNQILGGEAGMRWPQYDLQTTIKRGMNSPSIIMFSLGNEVQENSGDRTYDKMQPFVDAAEELIAWAREIDTTIPLTVGSNKLWAEAYDTDGAYEGHATIADMLTAVGGTAGSNYIGSAYTAIHEKHPDWFLYGSETASSVNSRGVYYKTDGSESNQDLTSYDQSCVSWGDLASKAWYEVITRDYVAGTYVWTGFDYLGEPTHWNGTAPGAVGTWPSPKNSFFGIIDTAGLPKDSYYLYQSLWNDDVTTLHVLPAWNEDVVVQAETVPVVVYSDAKEVELFFTPKGSTARQSLGKKAFTTVTTGAGYTYQYHDANGDGNLSHEEFYLTWNVAYADGTLTAVAYDEAGQVIEDTVGRSYVTTTGEEAKLSATVDRSTITADGKDLAYITVDVTDSQGNIVPDASNKVWFTVEGDGVLVGVDNGNQSDHQSYQDDNRKAYNGSLIGIVQSTKNGGAFTVTVSSDGLESDTVVVQTEAVEEDTSDLQLQSFYMSKNYYVTVGTKPVLPDTIETRYTDGTTQELPVVWNRIEAYDYAEAGTFGVNGVVDGVYSVSVVVNVLGDLEGLLNYSTATQAGRAPILPASRPAVTSDGDISDVAFPVTWETVQESQYNEAGIVQVTGTADVFGEEMQVTATVRVQNEQITISGKVDDAQEIMQDIPEDMQADNLYAIADGSTLHVPSPTDQSANENVWTNYYNSQAGDASAELTFRYATQQRLGEIVIHFFEDTWSATYPEAGTTRIYVSETGQDGTWTEIHTEESIGTAADNVKAYTYSFVPTTGTYIKIALVNNSDASGKEGGFTCTGITEVEIMKATGSFPVYTTAQLGALTVNGTALTEAQLEKGVYYVEGNTAVLENIQGKGNAAVTVLPEKEEQILILLESEDHKERDRFVIYLNEKEPMDPADDSRDVDVSEMTAIADSQYLPGDAHEGPVELILDGDADTHWHTNWSTTEASDVAKRWVGVTFSEQTVISGIRLLPRTYSSSGINTNGAIESYRIEYAEEADGEWIAIKEGTWDISDTGWKCAEFAYPVVAAKVRVVGVATVAADGNNLHMSVAEFRAVQGEGEGAAAGVLYKAVLAETIAKADAYDVDDSYTPDSVDAYFEAYVEAEMLYESEDVTQSEINAATEALQAAIKGLTKRADKTVLALVIEKAESLDEEDYTSSSWAESDHEEKLEEARAVYDDPNATAEAVKTAGNNLKAAVAALVLNEPEEPDTPEEPDIPVVPTEGYSVSLSDDVIINVGEDAQVTVNIYSEEDTYNTYHYVLTYDPDVLTYKSISGDAAVSDNNGTLTVLGYGRNKTTAETVTLTFTGKAPNGGDVTLTQANIDKAENADTQNAPAATIENAVTNIRVSGYTVTLSDDFTGDGAVNGGEDYSFRAKDPYYTYDFTATMSGSLVDVIANNDGTYTIENVTGDLVITATKTPMSFDVDVEGSGAADVTLSDDTATYRSDYTFELNRAEGYNYTVAVTVGGQSYSPSVEADGTYEISGSDIKGDIVITVTKTAASADTTQIIFTGNGSGEVVGSNPAIAENDQNFTFSIDKDELYDYTVRLEGSSQELTANSSGVYTINKNKLTGGTLTVVITKTSTVEMAVEATEYVKVQDGKSIFLITVTGPLDDGEVFAYDGNAMSYSEAYEAYAYLVISDKSLAEVQSEAEAMITEITVDRVEINYSGDVNGTGLTDVNDAQLAYNMYNARYSDFNVVSMEKFLRADMNHDKTLTVLDSAAIVEIIK